MTTYRQRRDARDAHWESMRNQAEAQVTRSPRRLPPAIRSMRALVADRAKRKETPR